MPPRINSSLAARTDNALINQQSGKDPYITSLAEAPSLINFGSLQYSSGLSHSTSLG
jgi:hypothetical protein